MPKRSGDADKAMDVAKKNATPSETSRPVIVNNRRIVQDPMMKPEDDSKEGDDTPAKTPMAVTAKTIQPLSQQDTEEKPKTETETTEKPEETGAKEPAAEEANDDPKNTEDAEDPAAEQAKEAAIVDAVASQATSKKEDEKIQTDDAKQKAIQKLIDDKKYFLPIGQITKRKQNKQALVLGAFVLVAIVGSYVALDMELIDSPVDLPFRFFK